MSQYLSEPTETRPWGAFQNLFPGKGFLVKLIEVDPGHRLSLQRHSYREEYWIVIEGSGTFTLDEVTRPIAVGEMIRVPLKAVHRVANTGKAPLLILEVQKGDYREDDIERLEDDYQR